MAETIRKIGLYGGTFDPVHLGHINLAIELCELRSLDEVWFCPAQANPHKNTGPVVDAAHRLEMLKLAIEGIPNFKIIENELQRQSPSFTVDTLNELKTAYPEYAFSLLLGEDSISGFFRWHLPNEILQIANVYIGSRTGEIDRNRYSGEDQKVFQALQQGMTQTRLMDISSTMIRDRLGRNLYSGHLIPAKVLDYIKQYSLYSSS